MGGIRISSGWQAGADYEWSGPHGRFVWFISMAHITAQIAQDIRGHNKDLSGSDWPFRTVKEGYSLEKGCFLSALRKEGVVPEDGLEPSRF